MPKQLTPQDEKRLAEAVDRVSDYAENMSPTEALCRVASEMSLFPGEIRATGHAYNTGAQLSQMHENKTALSRFAPFPLCDPEAVVRQQKKIARASLPEVSWEQRLPVWTKNASVFQQQKTAAAHSVPLETAPAAVFPEVGVLPDREQGIRKKAREWDARYAWGKKIAQLGRAWYDHTPAERLWAARVLSQQVGAEPALSLVALAKQAVWRDPLEQDKVAEEDLAETVVAGDHPLLLALEEAWNAAAKVAACIGQIRVVKIRIYKPWEDLEEDEEDRSRSSEQDEEEDEEYREDEESEKDEEDGEDEEDSIWLKRSGVAEVALGNMLAQLADPRSIGRERADRIINRFADKLSDPRHEDQIRAIKTKGMLARLLLDPEEGLTQVNPVAAAEVYNELTKLAPRGSQSSAIVGPWIRRRLEGKLEPFEAKTIADTEKSLSAPYVNRHLLMEDS